MNRRTAAGLLLLAGLLVGGRAVRHQLMLGPDGQWREPGWLIEQLPPAPPAASPPRTLIGKLAINTCSEDSLTLLPGIGPVLANRIVTARAAGVQFACPEDLCQVRGIGPVLSRRLAAHVRFGPEPPPSGEISTTDSLPHVP